MSCHGSLTDTDTATPFPLNSRPISTTLLHRWFVCGYRICSRGEVIVNMNDYLLALISTPQPINHMLHQHQQLHVTQHNESITSHISHHCLGSFFFCESVCCVHVITHINSLSLPVFDPVYLFCCVVSC